jgi:putative addiction module killer protein
MQEDKAPPPNVSYRLQSWRTHEIEALVLGTGKCPFEEWFSGMRDLKAKSVVRARLLRLVTGNFGSCRNLKGGLWELKIDMGPGYRVYVGRLTPGKALMLLGGDKSSQERDIEKARRYWEDFRKGGQQDENHSL